MIISPFLVNSHFKNCWQQQLPSILTTFVFHKEGVMSRQILYTVINSDWNKNLNDWQLLFSEDKIEKIITYKYIRPTIVRLFRHLIINEWKASGIFYSQLHSNYFFGVIFKIQRVTIPRIDISSSKILDCMESKLISFKKQLD